MCATAALFMSVASAAIASAPANAPVTLAPKPFSMTVPTPTGGDALIQEARRRSCRTVFHGKDYVVVGVVYTVVTFDYAHTHSLDGNLRFSNFPKWSPRGRAPGKIGDYNYRVI